MKTSHSTSKPVHAHASKATPGVKAAVATTKHAAKTEAAPVPPEKSPNKPPVAKEPAPVPPEKSPNKPPVAKELAPVPPPKSLRDKPGAEGNDRPDAEFQEINPNDRVTVTKGDWAGQHGKFIRQDGNGCSVSLDSGIDVVIDRNELEKFVEQA